MILIHALLSHSGNFGVVTRFRFKLYPRGPVLIQTAVHLRTRLFGLLPGAATVARKWRDWAESAPDETLPMLVCPAGGWVDCSIRIKAQFC